jgi:hypothetical protein
MPEPRMRPLYPLVAALMLGLTFFFFLMVWFAATVLLPGRRWIPRGSSGARQNESPSSLV